MATVVIEVVARMRTVSLIEHNPDNLCRVQGGQRFLDQPPRRPVSGHDQEEAVYPSANDAAVLDGGQGRGVDDDEIELSPRLVEDRLE